MSDLLVKFIHFYIFSIPVNSHKKAISVRVEILYRYSARVGIHLNSPNTDFWNSNKWDFSTESCSHWNPLKPVFHNLTAISNLLWAPYSKDGSRRHNMAWSLISKGHFIMGLKNTNGKVFCANYTMQRALNENILIKNVNNALWCRKKKRKKTFTCIGCLTPDITSGIFCPLSHFQIMKNLNLCVMAEAILFLKLLNDYTEKIDTIKCPLQIFYSCT